MGPEDNTSILPGLQQAGNFAYFGERTLAGENRRFQEAVDHLHRTFGFHFTAMGLAAMPGAPLKWVYSAGATSNRFKRIALAPGHGIGGIVLKAGKPMLLTDIDTELDPREYSSYPIVFAEDLRSFCALPLSKRGHVVGALLCAFRTAGAHHRVAFQQCIEHLGGSICGLAVTSSDFMDFEALRQTQQTSSADVFLGKSQLSQVIAAQEEERRRISRELHDGVAQELLTVSMQARSVFGAANQEEAASALSLVVTSLDTILDEMHNLSVDLRPSTLDHFGLAAALRSTAAVYQQRYGAKLVLIDETDSQRFNIALETQIYRILQEALLNSCKYSGCDQVTIFLHAADGWLSAQVIDQGTGFNTERPVIRGSGCGLSGMRERAALIGASLEIQSDEAGTLVQLSAPMFLGPTEDEEAS